MLDAGDNWLKSRWVEYILLGVITLLGTALRFYNLDVWSHWIDEYFSLESSLRPYLENLYRPYWVITKASLDLFGNNPTALRFPAFFFGASTIVLLYFPFKALFGKRVALLSSLFLAISPWHIYLSQLARWYALLLLVSTYALIFFYFVVERFSLKFLTGSILLTMLAFLLHLTAGFLIIIVMTYLFFLSRVKKLQPAQFNSKNLQIFFLVLAGLAILLIPKFIDFIREWNAIQIRDGYWGTTPIIFTSKVLYHLTPSMSLAAFLGVLILLKAGGRKGLFTAIFAVLPTALLNIAALFKTNISTKYVFFTLPALLLAASFLCVYTIDQVKKYRAIVAAALIGIVAIPSLNTDFYYFTSGHGNRDRLREAVQFISQQWSPQDRIFPLYFFPNPKYSEFYLKMTAKLEQFELADEQILAPATPETIDLGHRIWVVTIGKPLPPNSSGFYEWISKNAGMVGEFKANKGPRDNSVRIYLHRPETNQGFGKMSEMRAEPESDILEN